LNHYIGFVKDATDLVLDLEEDNIRAARDAWRDTLLFTLMISARL